ncbi:FmdB family zinc ribbon protein [Pandoraea pnomenusa]|uniref:FmdB family zinc ribbon protein n=1 Tax=Pandoraea pnomenusa TaxID=93220 RepID=UPI0033411577
MPIYAYRCETCGFAKDVLQKMSDDPLTQCPECGKDTFRKQVTAAGFQLKGSGWYVTDFRGGSGGTSAPATGGASSASSAPAAASGDSAASSSSGGESSSASAAPAACGGGCACH